MPYKAIQLMLGVQHQGPPAPLAVPVPPDPQHLVRSLLLLLVGSLRSRHLASYAVNRLSQPAVAVFKFGQLSESGR
jgi:hypothetical protein